ncbi:glycosyltransferase family 2 protein [Proteus sp. G2675]|uniref:Gt4 n=1 Tax=Proteus mirabilis TaxID=584 RepID=A0A385JP81_PROMI|nr:glycosyltransferase family 2 protein [Proteus sp. G2675]AXZ00104.1 gt4 [Proteus mirabilis]
MSIYISVISHGHSDLINKLSCLENLSKHYNIIIKSNKFGDDFSKLEENINIHWINNQYNCGFGKNNNIVYSYCVKNLKMVEDDYFIILNPDVIVNYNAINALIEEMIRDKVLIATINLFKDKKNSIYDCSIRMFPSLKHFIKSFLGLGNSSIVDKSKIIEPCHIDWAAGSFLAIQSCHYLKLGGFDEKYFMYCEDIDICYRSFLMNIPVKYYPAIHAIHLAKHANRKIFSKHFYWHFSSAIRFLLTKKNLTKMKSSI